MTTAGGLLPAELLKVRLLGQGIDISAAAIDYINDRNEGRPMTYADYASTSGVILLLGDDVWVNAPLSLHNPNFVADTPFTLDYADDGLVVHGDGYVESAGFWLQPAWHGHVNDRGEAYNSYGFTHADRVRISPIEGCALTCKFCDLPYEFRYRTKRVDGLLDVARVARADPIQPAGHVLISGGTPRPADYGYVRDVYEAVLTGLDMPVDIMMVPSEGLLDVPRLAELGVDEFSINVEVYNRDIARKVMRKKFDMGIDYYLDFIERAAEILGPARVRSMFMVGIEPIDDTLAGVRAVAERGGVPVLSPFRPDPSTPMRDSPAPAAEELLDVYLRARDICSRLDVPLGPRCIPCSHNTLTFARQGSGDAHRYYGAVTVV